MTKIKLFGSFSTFKSDSFEIHFKGSLLFENQQIKHACDLAGLLLNYCKGGVNDDCWGYLKNVFLKHANGQFSLVIAGGDNLILAVDIVRTHPLFIVENEDTWIVTDSLGRVGEKLVTNDKRIETFIACNMIVGNETIYENAFSVQAGEVLFFKEGYVVSERYFEFLPSKETREYESTESFSKDYEKTMLSVFSRMIDGNPTVNNWIVPLSGGRDSRLTVNLLYRLGVKDVICYSYGNPDNEQSRISRQVAQALGYQWFFVEYSEEKWLSLHEEGIIDDYVRYSFNGVSMPHLQDLLAFYELTKKNIIGTDDVVVKSHGDFIAGNHLLATDINISTLNEAMERITRQHTVIKDNGCYCYNRIKSLCEGSNIAFNHMPEYFDWQERQSKLMINSIRVYEFFHINSQLPFWDKESVNFWLGVDFAQRVKRNMFLKVVQNLLVDKLIQVPYAGMVKSSPKTSLQRRVVGLCPRKLIYLLLKITRRKVYLNEGLNLMFSLKSKSVKELLSPVNDFPKESLLYFKNILMRPTYQVNDNFLASLYTVRKVVLDKE